MVFNSVSVTDNNVVPNISFDFSNDPSVASVTYFDCSVEFKLNWLFKKRCKFSK